MSIGLFTTRHRIEPAEGMEQFQCDDSLVHYKLLSYLPFMIATNLATMLLSTVDGFVVGNLVGKEALAAVSIFMPISLVISILRLGDGSCEFGTVHGEHPVSEQKDGYLPV